MQTQQPILITGIPRSGATMIAAAINACGAFVGEFSKQSMYCNDRIRDCLVKPYFVLRNADPNAEKNYPQVITIPKNWKNNVETILSLQGYSGGPWLYKDSRLCQMWPVWDEAYPNAKWVIVRRRTGDILESCLRTKYMKSYDTREGWLEMVHEYEHRFVEMITEGCNCKIIWPERMIYGDYEQLYELCEWLGLKWNPESLKFIDTLLWKSRQKKGGRYGFKSSSK
jgi:hypothetical protein